MDSLQKSLEQIFCPTIDSALIAVIVSDNPDDFNSCFEILNSLTKEADPVLDAEGEEELTENELSSGNGSNNFRSSNVSSPGEAGEGSITSLECSIDGLSIEDELDYGSTADYDACNFEYSETNIEFLKNCFPMLSENRVDTLLRENDNNIDAVLDVILNEIYLETEQQEKEFSYSSSPLIPIKDSYYDKDNSLVSESRFNHRKKKKKRKQKQIIFQNNGHRSNSNRSPSPNSSSTIRPPTSSSSSSSSSSTSFSSCWNIRSSPSVYSKNNFDNKLDQLTKIFPNHKFERIKQVLTICNGEVQNAIEMLLSADTDNVWNIDKKQDKNMPYKRENQSIHLHVEEQPLLSLNVKIYDEDDGLLDYEDGYDPEHCYQKIYECFKKRNEAFEKAAHYYRKRVGGYYSDEGWKFDTEMNKWKLRASRSLVKKNSDKRNDEYVLDLHGCFVKEALIIVKEWLNDWYSKRMRSAAPLKPLKIITGKGNHSLNGVAKLPNAINKFLIKDNWKITNKIGYVLVHGLKNVS